MFGRVLERRPLASAAALSAALWTSFFLLLEPRYATNDDPLMAMLPAGAGFAAAPDEHLVFTNVLVGLALRRLHAVVPAAPWYALYLLATHVLAQIALLWAALRVFPRPRTVALFVAYFAVAAAPFANNLHFTVTAYVAAQAGVLLGLSLLAGAGRARAAAVVAVALAVLGALIRFEAFALALVLAVPAALVAGAGAWGRAVRGPGAVMAASLILALGARAFDAAWYARAAEWAAYREFNRAVAPFVDFERAKEFTPHAAAAFRAVGWSRNDHRLLFNWFHPVGDVFTTVNLRAVLAQPLPPATPASRRLRTGLRRILVNRPARPILFALPLALAASGAARRSRAAVLAGMAASAAVLAWLILALKAPPHVYLPVLAWPLALVLVLPHEQWGGRAGRLALALSALLAAAASARALAFQWTESVEGRAREASYRHALEALPRPRSRLFVLWSTFPYHVWSPLAPPASVTPPRFVALGWPQRMPTSVRALADLGHGDLMDALGDPDTRLVAPAEVAPWVEQYALRHREVALRLVPEASVPGFVVFHGARAAAGEAPDRVLRSGPAVPE
jgi:hypothetical protein